MLRTHKLGEADRIITLLTRSHGRVRAVGKGVRRTRSKFGSGLEPFTHVDLQVYEGRSLDVVQQTEILASYGDRLVDDYPRYTAGTAKPIDLGGAALDEVRYRRPSASSTTMGR